MTTKNMQCVRGSSLTAFLGKYVEKNGFEIAVSESTILNELVTSVYLSSLPDAPTPKDGYLLRGIVQGYRTKLLRAPPGSLTCPAYSTVKRDLGLMSHPKDY